MQVVAETESPDSTPWRSGQRGESSPQMIGTFERSSYFGQDFVLLDTENPSTRLTTPSSFKATYASEHVIRSKPIPSNLENLSIQTNINPECEDDSPPTHTLFCNDERISMRYNNSERYYFLLNKLSNKTDVCLSFVCVFHTCSSLSRCQQNASSY